MAFVGLGVSGGIGAYKAVEVARLLQQRGHRVQAILTRNARRFVGPLTFEAITRERVLTSQFTPGMNADIEHIALASSLDVLLVAPATANIIGKFATRHRRRLPVVPLSGLQGARADGAGHEHQHVGASRRDRQRGHARGARRALRGARDPATWRAAGSARAAWPNRTPLSKRSIGCCSRRPRRSPAARDRRDRRPDDGRSRSRAVSRESVEWADGVCHRARGRPARRQRDARRRADAGRSARGRRTRARAQRARHARRGHGRGAGRRRDHHGRGRRGFHAAGGRPRGQDREAERPADSRSTWSGRATSSRISAPPGAAGAGRSSSDSPRRPATRCRRRGRNA